MKRKFLILGLIVVAPACFLLMTQVLRSKQAQESTPVLPVLIQLDKGGFIPKEVKIKPGTLVRWKNISGAPQTVNSNDYPTNQLHKELNFGIFNSGSSFMFVFSQPGSYGYHNQFHPEQQGTIIVKR